MAMIDIDNSLVQAMAGHAMAALAGGHMYVVGDAPFGVTYGRERRRTIRVGTRTP